MGRMHEACFDAYSRSVRALLAIDAGEPRAEVVTALGIVPMQRGEPIAPTAAAWWMANHKASTILILLRG